MLGQVFRSLFAHAPREGARSSTGAAGFDVRALNGVPGLARRVEHSLRQDFSDNFDAERWGHPDSPDFLGTELRIRQECVNLLLDHPAALPKALGLMADDASRAWMEDLFAFRILGHRRVRLASNNAAHWARRAQAAALAKSSSAFIGPFGQMNFFEMDYEGRPVRLDAYAANVAWTFLLGQYSFSRGGAAVAIKPTDVVIDAGCCFGDTALAFAVLAGGEGRVHCFEIDPGNLAIARHNIGANPELAARIVLNASALGEKAGTLYLHGSGPGARVLEQPSSHPVAVCSIDGYVTENRLPRVDFIKMDIEGAEFEALKGAVETIKAWRPRLALSVYHHAADLVRIPAWIDQLGLGYRLFLDHYTIHHEETVLYALPPVATVQ